MISNIICKFLSIYIYIRICLKNISFRSNIVTDKGYIFGSEIDWANQHIVITEYFRSMFYKTGHLIPHLALNLGMGQNIFYFTYYGLLSPIILLSYLLPFIPMYIYMLIAVFLSITASSILFYKWNSGVAGARVGLKNRRLGFDSLGFHHDL